MEIGRRRADTSNFLYLTDQGKELEIVYRLWVVQGNGETVIVDTGPPLEEAHRRGITNVRSITPALASVGVDPKSVGTVLLTHLHWDHASNAEEFPRAQFLAQRREVEFFGSECRRHPSINRFYSHEELLNDLIRSGRVTALDGEQDVRPGLRVIPVGGHTPGSQMIAILMDKGSGVITGDAIPLVRNYVENIPSGILVDIVDAIAALDRVRSMRPRVLFPAHDVADLVELEC